MPLPPRHQVIGDEDLEAVLVQNQVGFTGGGGTRHLENRR
jgi:hypothetical protein